MENATTKIKSRKYQGWTFERIEKRDGRVEWFGVHESGIYGVMVYGDEGDCAELMTRQKCRFIGNYTWETCGNSFDGTARQVIHEAERRVRVIRRKEGV